MASPVPRARRQHRICRRSQKPGCLASKPCNGSALPRPPARPKPSIDKLHAAVIKALNDPEVKKRYEELAMTPAPSASPEEYAKFVHDEGVRWHKVVEDAHIVAQ